MIKFSSTALMLFNNIPGNTLDMAWSFHVERFCQQMNEENPTWLDGCELLEEDGTLAVNLINWSNVLHFMAEQGSQFLVDNCTSYWYMKRKTAKWATIPGEHSLIELCYVSSFGDMFAAHATEYFASRAVGEAKYALAIRCNQDLTTKCSGTGYSVEEAIADNDTWNALEAMNAQNSASTVGALHPSV